ncbi:MAG: thioredoxin family protein [Acidobacteriia bacterium]|nr:thioredoxin family protein [Terriglobia bacterium]
MNITVYGPGCAKCKETERRVRHVLEASGVDANVTKAVDFVEMAKAGVLATPAIAIDGIVKLSGRVPNEDEIKAWLTEI